MNTPETPFALFAAILPLSSKIPPPQKRGGGLRRRPPKKRRKFFFFFFSPLGGWQGGGGGLRGNLLFCRHRQFPYPTHLTHNKTNSIGKLQFPMKKKSTPLYVIRKLEKGKEQELLSTTDLEVAISYFNRLARAKVKNLTFTTYD